MAASPRRVPRGALAAEFWARQIVILHNLHNHKLLVTTQETFADLLRQEGRSETDADPIEAEASSSAPVNPGTFRTFKEAARAALNPPLPR
jgi:hypothetical protein